MMNLKARAKTHKAFGGAVTFWMLPWLSFKFNMVSSRINVEIGNRDEWTGIEEVFALLEGVTVDIDFDLDDETPQVIYAFSDYWQNRTGNFAEDFEMFVMCADTTILNAVHEAFGQTRETIAQNGRLDGDSEEVKKKSSQSTGSTGKKKQKASGQQS